MTTFDPREQFNFNDENEKIFRDCKADFEVKEDKIIAKEYLAYKVEKDAAKLFTINTDEEWIKMPANFDVYVHKDDPKKAYKTSIVLNTVLKINYNIKFENTKEFIFMLDKGEELISENKFIKTVDNASNAFFYVLSGRLKKLEKTGDYNKLLQVMMKIMEDNEISGHPAKAYEILIAELCRDKKNTSVPFRFTVNDTNMRTGYISINIRSVPRNQSSISALFSEDIMQSLTTTINNKVQGKKPALTPIEEITLNKFND